MHTKTHAHAWHLPHAEVLIPRPTIYAQICIHLHIHTCINAQMYKYIHTCIYIHISCLHTYRHTHIYTHAYKMYIWTHAKHVWNDGAAATARETQLDTKKLCPSPCPHHDSAPSRPHPLICTGTEPIHPVHFPRQLPAWPWPHETRSLFYNFGGFFFICRFEMPHTHLCLPFTHLGHYKTMQHTAIHHSRCSGIFKV